MHGCLKSVLVVVLGLSMWNPALAQDVPTDPPVHQEILQECIASLRSLVTDARSALGDQTRETVASIRALAEQGAPKPVILQAGQEGAGAVREIAGAARAEIRETGAECILALREVEAPRRATKLAVGVTKIAHRVVHRGGQRSHQIIRAVMRRALQQQGQGETPIVLDQQVIPDAEIQSIALPAPSPKRG